MSEAPSLVSTSHIIICSWPEARLEPGASDWQVSSWINFLYTAMISRKKPRNSSKLWLKHEKWSQEKIRQINFSWHHFKKKKLELKILSEGCCYALVIKGHNRAAQILVKIILDGPVELFSQFFGWAELSINQLSFWTRQWFASLWYEWE